MSRLNYVITNVKLSIPEPFGGLYISIMQTEGAQWLSGRVLDSRTEGPRVRASPASLCQLSLSKTHIS